ncbi:hypothetical protein EIK56_24240 [Sphingomonas sp. C8-2]|jgi:hypothetical protein|nr:hypothetical protein EIK56_24240 [Sphingomonas sp. C8-2]
MTSLGDLARHWSRQTEKGKGIRIEADALDVLNAIGVGELIQMKAAEAQREACKTRMKGSTSEGATGSAMIERPMEAFVPRISRSSGMMRQQDVTASAARAQRTSNRRKTN